MPHPNTLPHPVHASDADCAAEIAAPAAAVGVGQSRGQCSQSADPQFADSQSNDPQSANPQSANPQSANPQSANPQSASPQSANPQSANPQSASPQSADPQSANPQSANPQSASPQSADSQSADPQSADPQSIAQSEPQAVAQTPGPQPEQQLGRLIVLTGPSGVGKGTLVKALLRRRPELHLSISATTRSPRTGETHGIDYFFLSRAEFESAIAAGQLLEWAEFAGNYYGTPRQPIQDALATGQPALLEIELEGARQVRDVFPEALRIFILPPSMDELERRLRDRGSDAPEVIDRRLQRARVEVAAAQEFDVQIINDDLNAAIEAIETLLFPPQNSPT